MVSGFGVVALGLLAANGTGLYLAARAHSWLGVLVLLSAPVLFVYGLDPPYFTRMILGLFRRQANPVVLTGSIWQDSRQLTDM